MVKKFILVYNGGRGDRMKLKRYHLFLFATIVFLGVFIGINNKYDRFYRIPGINNENRILIENYLDDDSQNYLIEHNIGINQIIEYMVYADFNIQNYEYYPIVEQSNSYASMQEVVTQTNNIVDKLAKESPWAIMDNLNTLANAKLLPDYANNENFNFKHITVYQKLKSIYAVDDYSYLNLVDGYIESLNKLGYQSIDECSDVLVKLFTSYTPDQVGKLIDLSIEANKPVYLEDPTSLTAVLNNETTVDTYVPKDLELLDELPRYTYFLYLRHDAYEALKKMCEAYEQSADYQPYFVLSAYESYETAYESDPNSAGHKEEQLGMTLSFQVTRLAVDDFPNSKLYHWLLEHAYEYGFILRYPQGQESVTGREYNTYTYRYVGEDVAKQMKENGYQTLEEYNEKIKVVEIGEE